MYVCVYVIRSLSLCVSTMSAVSVTEKEEKRERERKEAEGEIFDPLFSSLSLSLSYQPSLLPHREPPSPSSVRHTTLTQEHCDERERRRWKESQSESSQKRIWPLTLSPSFFFLFVSRIAQYPARYRRPETTSAEESDTPEKAPSAASRRD